MVILTAYHSHVAAFFVSRFNQIARAFCKFKPICHVSVIFFLSFFCRRVTHRVSSPLAVTIQRIIWHTCTMPTRNVCKMHDDSNNRLISLLVGTFHIWFSHVSWRLIQQQQKISWANISTIMIKIKWKSNYVSVCKVRVDTRLADFTFFSTPSSLFRPLRLHFFSWAFTSSLQLTFRFFIGWIWNSFDFTFLLHDCI